MQAEPPGNRGISSEVQGRSNPPGYYREITKDREDEQECSGTGLTARSAYRRKVVVRFEPGGKGAPQAKRSAMVVLHARWKPIQADDIRRVAYCRGNLMTLLERHVEVTIAAY